MTPSTRAAADAPIRWPPAVVSANQAPQSMSGHAWPSVDGLIVALGWLWTMLKHHPCLRRHATPRIQMELPRPPGLPDQHDKTFGVCVSFSSSKRLPAGRLNRSTCQNLGDRPLRRRCLRDVEHNNIPLVAALIVRRLVGLRHHGNVVVD